MAIKLPPVTKHTNEFKIHPSVGVWLALDEYVADADPYTISTTTLIKPIRQLILSIRAKQKGLVKEDLSERFSSALGTAIHNDIKRVWETPELMMYGLKAMGMPAKKATRHAVNPHPEWLKQNPDAVPVYVEQRYGKKVGKWTITGEMDVIYNGEVIDHKKCPVFLWKREDGFDKFIMQGSIYRWIKPELITKDTMIINLLHADWKSGDAVKEDDPDKYPETPVTSFSADLAPIEDTEAFIKKRIEEIDYYISKPQSALPECTPEELWQDKPTYKFYNNPEKTARATKNFDNEEDAQNHLAETNAKKKAEGKGKPMGIIVTDYGKPRACKYCAGKDLCHQYEMMVDEGII